MLLVSHTITIQQLNMEVNAKTLIDQGHVPIGIRLQWMQQTSKKKIVFKHLWQRTTLGTSRDFFSPDDNGIALVTGGASDLIIIDCDVLKDSERDDGVQDGLVLFQELVQKHGLPENTPVQRTASGGLHYFFSLSKSLKQDLDIHLTVRLSSLVFRKPK